MRRDALERLRRLALHRPDCTFYVAVPLRGLFRRARQWEAVRVVEGTLTFSSGEVIDVDQVRRFAVVYPNGEIVECELGNLGLPPGTSSLVLPDEVAPRRIDAETLAAGQRRVAVSFTPSLIRPDDRSYYTTTLRNDTAAPVRIESFAPADVFQDGARLVAVVANSRYRADQFAAWYAAPGATIAGGASVRDVSNWGQPPVAWVYDVVLESGERFTTGGVVCS